MIGVGVAGVVILVPAIVYLALRMRYKKYTTYVCCIPSHPCLTRCSPPWAPLTTSRTCNR